MGLWSLFTQGWALPLTCRKQWFIKWLKPNGKLSSSPSILLTAPSPALGKAQWKAISFLKTMPPPPDLWYYPQGKHAPIYQPLTRGTGRRWWSCVIPFKLTDGWRCSLLRQPPFTMGNQGYQAKDLCPTHSWPLKASPSGSPWEFRKC